MRNMFLTASINLFIAIPCRSRSGLARSRRSLLRPASYNLKRAPGFGNFLLGRSAEGVRVNRQLGLELAIAQDLDGVRGTTDEAMRTKQFGRHRLSRRENVK